MAVVFGKIGTVLLGILKFLLLIALGIFRLTLVLVKIFLILLSLIFRIFAVFVRAGTP